MTYRLKDEGLQRRLDNLTNGKFSQSLEECIDPTDFQRTFYISGVGDVRVRLCFEVFEAMPEVTNKDLKMHIRAGLRDLHGIFSRIKADLDVDEPDAASVRWGLAKGIIGCIDKWLEEYERRKKEGKE